MLCAPVVRRRLLVAVRFSLLPGEPRRALFAEGGDALRVILRAAGDLLHVRLVVEHSVEVRHHGAVEGALRQADGACRQRGEPGASACVVSIKYSAGTT